MDQMFSILANTTPEELKKNPEGAGKLMDLWDQVQDLYLRTYGTSWMNQGAREN